MTDAPASHVPPFRSGAGRVGSETDRAVSTWLWIVAAMVFLMVFLGGATRLTESGLSITEWKPVTGVVPPLGQSAWQEAFDRYKQIPQYASLFPNMTLGHFQAIFLMEWTHRLVARLLGFVLVVPMVVFWIRHRLTRRLKWQLVGILFLGTLQGFVGWWMVSSGLSGRVEVAQQRLAIHLLLASVTFAALVWIAAAQRHRDDGEIVPKGLRLLATAMVLLVFVQIGFGALVAGLRAGMAFNTWPLMEGHFIPPRDLLASLTPLWRNLVDNIATVQFQHRMTAYLILALALVQAAWSLSAASGTGAARRSVVVAALVAVQAGLGIVTLLLAVPLWAGLLHQLFAMLVLAMVVVHRQKLASAALATHRSPLVKAQSAARA